MNDFEKLDQFLKENAPQPPKPAPGTQESRLNAVVNAAKDQAKTVHPWQNPLLALAAALAIVVITGVISTGEKSEVNELALQTASSLLYMDGYEAYSEEGEDRELTDYWIDLGEALAQH